jgi:hypothetical protein
VSRAGAITHAQVYCQLLACTVDVCTYKWIVWQPMLR